MTHNDCVTWRPILGAHTHHTSTLLKQWAQHMACACACTASNIDSIGLLPTPYTLPDAQPACCPGRVITLQERAELLASNRKEVGQLLEARVTAESAFTDKYLAAVGTYAQNLEQLRHADGEDYQVLKIK